jgi:hypothetical protein
MAQFAVIGKAENRQKARTLGALMAVHKIIWGLIHRNCRDPADLTTEEWLNLFARSKQPRQQLAPR